MFSSLGLDVLNINIKQDYICFTSNLSYLSEKGRDRRIPAWKLLPTESFTNSKDDFAQEALLKLFLKEARSLSSSSSSSPSSSCRSLSLSCSTETSFTVKPNFLAKFLFSFDKVSNCASSN